MLENLAFALLNISFDTDEWSNDFLDSALNDVMYQLLCIKHIKDTRETFDTTIDLWDLLCEVYERGFLKGDN